MLIESPEFIHGEDVNASWLSKTNAYASLGDNGYGRILQEGDL